MNSIECDERAMDPRESMLMGMDRGDRVMVWWFSGISGSFMLLQHLIWGNVNGEAATVVIAVLGAFMAYAVIAGRIYRRNVQRARAIQRR